MSSEIHLVALPSGFASIDRQIGWRGSPRDNGDLFQFAYGSKTGWKLVAEFDGEIGSAWIVVDDPISFRVHDERELIAYWVRRDNEGISPAFGYEISKSIYLDEISQGVSGLVAGSLRHFLVGGQNQCLEIISKALPRVTYTPPEFEAG